jgi:hypothetical protein
MAIAHSQHLEHLVIHFQGGTNSLRILTCTSVCFRCKLNVHGGLDMDFKYVIVNEIKFHICKKYSTHDSFFSRFGWTFSDLQVPIALKVLFVF